MPTYDVFTSVIAAATATPPADPYDLVDLATVKAELRIDSGDITQDANLTREITQVSTLIRTHCNRIFQLETVQELIFPPRDAYPYQIPGGAKPLQLTRWPLIGPPFTLQAGSTTISGTVLTMASTAGVAKNQPVTHRNVPTGALVADFVADTSVTLSKALTGPVLATDSIGFGLAVIITDPPGANTTLVSGIDWLTEFSLDRSAGDLTKLDQFTGYPTLWPPVQTTVLYQAGYSTIPADLQDATLRVITMRNSAQGRDPLLKSREQPGIGTEAYWIGTAPGVKGALPEEVTDLLDGKYRVPVTA